MIIIPAIVENISTRKDNTLKVVLGTNEITPEKAGQLVALQNKMAYVAIKAEMFNPNEQAMISELKADEQIGKTPSQRLRSVLFILYEQNNEGFKSYSDYYINKMEGFIAHFKSKIDG